MTYDLSQFLTARSLLRQKLELPTERFDGERIVGMLSDEIEQAANRGIGFEEMSEMLKQAGIDLPQQELERHFEQAKAYKALKGKG